MAEQKKVIYSAIQPTGCMTIGNYIGAVNNWLPMQDENDCIFAIADLHSLTVRQDPAELRARSLSFFAQYIALGLDPEKSVIYIQSSVHQHAELAWILNCYTYIGEMERMTQFKDKSQKHVSNINMGLLAYPVLMAADILLFNSNEVPIGLDQKQHLEIARDIATRFNNVYGDVFTIPEPYIPKAGAKITSLQNPEAKMSKSDPNVNGYISIIDSPDVIVSKLKKAVTDSENSIRYHTSRPGISNLMTIYSVLTGQDYETISNNFDGKGYGQFKLAVADAIIAKLAPFQAEYARVIGEKDYLYQIAKVGMEKAEYLAMKTLRKVYKKVGLSGVQFK